MELKENLSELIREMEVYLREEVKIKPNTVREYIKTWTRLKHYADSLNIERYNTQVGKEYLESIMGNKYRKDMTTHEKRVFKGIKILNEYQETGKIEFWPICQKTFRGEIGTLMVQYLSSREIGRLNKNTISTYRTHLYRFLVFIEEKHIDSIIAITPSLFIEYCSVLNNITNASTHIGLRMLRSFFKYLFDEKLTATDYSAHIPKEKFVHQPKLPTKYTKEEVEKIRLSIDRASKKGKRDYGIFLLAARLGLRSSDIKFLKFENIDWDKNIIKLNQYKTGKYIELPLLSEVGNAIVDYLQYGRPVSDSSFVFLEAIYPYAPLNQGISRIFDSIFRNSGIDIKDRKHGSHALRHSLAVRMLEENTILPVITEVLGHENTNSTKYYLRIDINSLKKCVLDVPKIESSFYCQKGGTFYV